MTGKGLEVGSLVHFLEHVYAQSLLGDTLLETGVLLLQPLEALGFLRTRHTVLSFTAVKSGLGDVDLPSHLRGGRVAQELAFRFGQSAADCGPSPYGVLLAPLWCARRYCSGTASGRYPVSSVSPTTVPPGKRGSNTRRPGVSRRRSKNRALYRASARGFPTYRSRAYPELSGPYNTWPRPSILFRLHPYLRVLTSAYMVVHAHVLLTSARLYPRPLTVERRRVGL